MSDQTSERQGSTVTRFLWLLLLLTAITIVAGRLTTLVASPQTREEGAEIGNLMILVLVGVASFSLHAVLLRRAFRDVQADTALGLLFLSAVLSAISLALLIPSKDPTASSLAIDRILAFFFVFLLPGLLVGLLLFAVIPRRS